MAKEKENLETENKQVENKEKSTEKEKKKKVTKEEKMRKKTAEKEEKSNQRAAKKEEKVKRKEETKKKKSKEKKKEVEEIEETTEEIKEKKTKKKKKKKKKKKYVYGPIEYSFNFISLVFAISVGLYFGWRSFYYYSLQNQTHKEVAMTLNGIVLENNKLMKENETGFHKDEEGYFFKGNVDNNYVWFANRMFRIMRVNDDSTVKLVTDDNIASFMWGMDKEYENSNVRLWLTNVEEIAYSGVYYNTIPSPNKFLSPTKYTLDKLNDNKVETGEKEYKDSIAPLTLNDYIEAGGNSSYLNNGKLYYLIGYSKENENLYVEEDGSIATCDSLDGYGIRSVITLGKNIPVSQGNGTKDNPYVINQGSDTNYVDSYVKLGEDIWKVYEDKDGKLKMYLNGYIKENGEEYVRNYSSYSTKLSFYENDNIGKYLFEGYEQKLPYESYLIENTYPYGEFSAETSYRLESIYSETYSAKIAMLNIFDYVSNNELSDFFRDNTGGMMSTRQYSVLSNGLLEEAEVTDVKHIVPVVSIEAKSIKSGTGRIDNPYVVEG